MKFPNGEVWTRPTYFGLAKELEAGRLMLEMWSHGRTPGLVAGRDLLTYFVYPSLQFEISLADEFDPNEVSAPNTNLRNRAKE